MSFCWTSPTIPYLLSNGSHIRTTKSEAEWLEPMFYFGGLTGLPITVILVVKFGCKNSLMIAAAAQMLAWTLTGLANNIWHLFSARIIFGAAENMAMVAAPIYISELADQNIRGFLSGFVWVLIHTGYVVMNSIGFESYYIAPILGVFLGVIQLMVFPFLPETPYYYISRDSTEEAKHSLMFFKPYSDVNKEIDEITETLQKQKSDKGRWQDLLLVKSNRKALFIMLILRLSHHLSAYASILMNLCMILEAADSTYIQASHVCLLFAVAMLIAVAVCSSVVDNFGRKILLITSGVASGCCVIGLGIYFHLKHTDHNVYSASWIPIVLLMLYAASFKFGVGTVPLIVAAEIFPTKLKPTGIIIGDFVYLVSGICSVRLYQVLSDSWGMYIAFYCFGLWSFIAVLFTYLYVPETKGKSLDEIQMILKGMYPSEAEPNVQGHFSSKE